jgi:hypothetical protein
MAGHSRPVRMGISHSYGFAKWPDAMADTPMKFDAFVKAIDQLVDTWNGPVVITDKALSQKLKVIYDQVRNDTAWQLAQMQAKLDKHLPRYHKQLLQQTQKGKNE